tara:strand:- start:433 stop:666 length:234 start_codon:yes stop_codon:yes gene_type:complete
MIFILKLMIIMELIDTPNPNAKKIIIEVYKKNFSDDLLNIDGVASIFFGPGFVTITKEENIEWTSITQEILNIFDRL